MRDPESMIKFTEEEAATLVVDNLKPSLLEVGLLARADNRGDAILQYSPPLIAGTAEIDEIVEKSRTVLTMACDALGY
jgi:adenosylmethionine-8-amino-7-oxononanoate aminotransferase